MNGEIRRTFRGEIDNRILLSDYLSIPQSFSNNNFKMFRNIRRGILRAEQVRDVDAFSANKLLGEQEESDMMWFNRFFLNHAVYSCFL